ncbi:hypothetical protein ACH42_01535 [Endozoicomonas sp. (ex Bugula neritina AB1)]|nr:hypothetical protein ACH42_01535 [Endozoicomonas sp. (ex Bugula neritina AB1)]
MTETQYLLGWAIYLLGGTGCLLGLWLIVRQWHPRIKRFVIMLFAVLIYLPGITRPDMDFMAPAFLISLFDGLTYGPEGMVRAGQTLVMIAGSASLIAALLPIGKQASKKTKRQNSDKGSDTPSVHGKPQRKEPTY